jgi:FrmR/RcnR family transcriptional regulator, repressor of frmRAB operon
MALETRTWASSPRSQSRYTVIGRTRTRSATSRTVSSSGVGEGRPTTPGTGPAEGCSSSRGCGGRRADLGGSCGVDSRELAAFTAERRWDDLRNTAVFARVTPEDKLSIVKGPQIARSTPVSRSLRVSAVGVKQGFPGHGLRRWDPELELRELPGFVVGREVTVPSRRHRHVGVSERPLERELVLGFHCLLPVRADGQFEPDVSAITAANGRLLSPIPYGSMDMPLMAHTTREKTKLLVRVRRITGQVQAIERALESEKSCSDVLQLIAAARGAINGLMTEVLEDHIRLHVVDPATDRSRKRARGAAELIEVVRSYLR